MPNIEKTTLFLQKLAAVIDISLNGAPGVNTTGFVLLTFPTNTPKPLVNYTSNCNREDVIKALREFLTRMERDVHEAPKGVQ